MKVGDRVLDKVSGDEGFIESISGDGKIVSCWVGAGPDRHLSSYPKKDLVEVGPKPQSTAGMDYDPLMPRDGYKPF